MQVLQSEDTKCIELTSNKMNYQNYHCTEVPSHKFHKLESGVVKYVSTKDTICLK